MAPESYDEEYQEDETIVLTDDDGQEHTFELLDVIDVDGNRYAVLTPEEDEQEDEAVVLRIEEDEDGDEVLVDIEDDAEWERVAARWEEIQDEWEDEEDYEYGTYDDDEDEDRDKDN